MVLVGCLGNYFRAWRAGEGTLHCIVRVGCLGDYSGCWGAGEVCLYSVLVGW